MKKKSITTETLDFFKDNVLNVSELTRTTKLSEILDQYAVKETEEVYIVKNSKNKNAVGVLADLDHYKRLLKTQELFDRIIDDHMHDVSVKRKDDEADIPLSRVKDDHDFDVDELLNQLDDFELDED